MLKDAGTKGARCSKVPGAQRCGEPKVLGAQRC